LAVRVEWRAPGAGLVAVVGPLSIIVANGPASTREKSRTFSPSSAPEVTSSPGVTGSALDNSLYTASGVG
jgi:hypothetical protein